MHITEFLVKLTKLMIFMGLWLGPDEWSPCSRLIQQNSRYLDHSHHPEYHLWNEEGYCHAYVFVDWHLGKIFLFFNPAKNKHTSKFKCMGISGRCWRRLGLHPEEVMGWRWSVPQAQAVTELWTEPIACVSGSFCFHGSERVLLIEMK